MTRGAKVAQWVQVIANYSSGGATRGGKSYIKTISQYPKPTAITDRGRQDSNLRPSAPKAPARIRL